MPFTALASKVYKDAATVQWANSLKDNFDFLITGTNKVWVHFDGDTSTVTAKAGNGVSNIVDSGVGLFRIVFTSDFATTSYAPWGFLQLNGGTGAVTRVLITRTINSGYIEVQSDNGAGTQADSPGIFVGCVGARA